MNKVINIILVALALPLNVCSQPLEENILGCWALNSSYEFPDIIVIRSDHKYFVYNSNSVNTESLGLKENLIGGDILINNSYTSLTEKGNWNYIKSSNELILKERKFLDEASDFIQAYGSLNELRFYIKKLTKDEMEICFDKKGEKICDKYERNFTYTTNKGTKIFYNEIKVEYSETGTQTKEILISGYETDLEVNYDFFKKEGLLVIEDDKGKQLFSTEKLNPFEKTTKKITLRGVTRVLFKVITSQPNSKWKICVTIK